jgi:exodeoxyribonuclease VII small subunit
MSGSCKVPKHPKQTDTTPDLLDFESSLAELEKLVERLERGDQTLEESLKDFERGVTLAKTCQSTLKKAEQRVEALIKKNGDFAVESCSPEE